VLNQSAPDSWSLAAISESELSSHGARADRSGTSRKSELAPSALRLQAVVQAGWSLAPTRCGLRAPVVLYR